MGLGFQPAGAFQAPRCPLTGKPQTPRRSTAAAQKGWPHFFYKPQGQETNPAVTSSLGNGWRVTSFGGAAPLERRSAYRLASIVCATSSHSAIRLARSARRAFSRSLIRTLSSALLKFASACS